jgi:hypothetical protein
MKRLLQFGLLSLCFASTAAYAQPSVIVENFRNVNCGNCREPDIQFEQWIEANKSKYDVDVIYFHNEITDPSDPFYQATKPEVDYRNGQSFYNIDANPRVFVQGQDATSQISIWQYAVDEASKQTPKATVAVSELKNLGDNKYSFKVNVTNSSGEPVRVYAAMTESGIIYNNPKLYGNPPSGKWDHIYRKMLPVREGAELVGNSGEFTFALNLQGKNWNIANMEAVVFVQSVNKIPNSNSRPIWGHTVQSFAMMDVAPANASGFSIKSLANPVSISAPLEVRMSQYGHLRIEMIDMTGKKIATIADNSLPEGLYHFNDRMELAVGAYVVNAYVDGNFAGQVKLIKQ